MHPAATSGPIETTELNRDAFVAWYRHNRARSRAIFDLLVDEAYYTQPIALRHPIVFYEGHLPGFSFNTLVKKALGGASIDARLEELFARGIDPAESAGGQAPGQIAREWPSRRDVSAFVDEADRRVIDAVPNADVDRAAQPLPDRADAVYAILEHDAMHQETLLYMFHRLPYDQKIAPAAYRPQTHGVVPRNEWIEIPAGRATLGIDRGSRPFVWDNECPAFSAEVPAFSIDRHNVTNARFMEFVEAGGYRDSRWWTVEDWQWLQSDQRRHPSFWATDGQTWSWRGMFEHVPLQPAWPVFVTLAEASAFARWRG